jgi:hypothetical protein
MAWYNASIQMDTNNETYSNVDLSNVAWWKLSEPEVVSCMSSLSEYSCMIEGILFGVHQTVKIRLSVGISAQEREATEREYLEGAIDRTANPISLPLLLPC